MKIAMILAAGRGERLRPLTDTQPKAMCLVHQKPLIQYHVEKLARSGFERIVINHAHLGGQIRHYLGDGAKWDVEICYAPEPPGGLETGGGIYNALPLLGKDPFITVNADIFTDYEFSSLHLANDAKLHLVLVNNPSHNAKGDFDLIHQNKLSNKNKRYTYSGIACYRPEAFEQYKAGRYSVVSLFHSLIKENRATGELYQGLWVDIGSAERLKFANALL
ncbi:N-acetylmuramate alpha-1-phosphate uridylyltransferase MurU [Legionella micdadei]|uniref:Mannose-1-phosphate guanyltransferase n=1 Tax=Legionella micdadei TaxID=451 RepID=A0A098GKQ7_LEGMI|nr:nucleotidyltransferase family protein [Legionella micdadei]ARG98544.1 mannose-1-phosphate guanylyltransferase [Legionella micdadei]ARH01288.1 mannose-1-phosphate guanylyltransferase [Legionella micdadei]KTD27404.1 nucleotidyltransferase [Legionella micdadei]NSL19386.1 nucleotidyltransferase family protein [Legionella micdadei]CEG62111.1 Mannose-1-phosphate guanyltransferase [Legionella micdadei]